MIKKFNRLKKYSYGDWMNATGNSAISQQSAQNQAYNMGTYQNTNDFGKSNAEGTYDTIFGAVGSTGAVGGVVSTAVGVGNAIADPIREDALATSGETGGYVDKKNATTTETVGTFVDPLKASLESYENDDPWYQTAATALGWGAAFQKSKVEDQDKELREAYRNEKIARGKQYQYQNALQDYSNRNQSEYAGLNSFEIGGFISNSNSNSLNNGRKYNGKSHEDSIYEGIPVDSNGEPTISTGREPVGLTEGNEFKYKFRSGDTYIFSDKF